MSDPDPEFWERFYSRPLSITEPSPFAQFVAARYPNSCMVIDIGCGNGRDSLYFSTAGRTVFGFDASKAAIERCRIANNTLNLSCSFDELDVESRSFVDQIKLDLNEFSSTLIYARFFLHAIPERAEALFLDSAASLVRKGARLCLEFRTPEDARLPKAEGIHFRRFIDPDDLRQKGESRSMTLEYQAVGQGLAVYKDEDPFVARMIFRKGT